MSLLGWLYERLYYELAWAYDPVSWLVSSGRWHDWQRAALPFLVGETVLDVACGTGHLLRELLQRGQRAFGLDRSAEMQARANRRLRDAGFAGRVVGANALAMPFPEVCFDSVVCTFPTPIIREVDFWREVARVLRPGGRAVVVLGARAHRVTWRNLPERSWQRLAAAGGPESRRLHHVAETSLPTGALHQQMIAVEVAGSTVFLLVAEKSPRTAS